MTGSTRTATDTRGLGLGLALGLALGLLPYACSKEKASLPFPKSVLSKLKKAGLKVGDFKDTEPKKYQAARCAEGKVSGLSVLLCEYKDAGSAERAESRLLRFVGNAVTGAVRRNGKTVMAVADPDKTDIKGKTVNKLLTAF